MGLLNIEQIDVALNYFFKWIKVNTEYNFLLSRVRKNEIGYLDILKLYEYFEDTKNVYLIIEMCTGGELFDKII